jgi:HSP20 family protein
MALPTRVSRGESYDPFQLAQREFDRMIGSYFGGGRGEQEVNAPYCVDVLEDADHVYVEAELPGFTKKDIDITMENQTLTITAERKEQRKEGEKDGDYLLRERRYHRFQRSFMLPQTVDEQNVQAKLDEGVLKITLNKKEESKPRKIQVG